MLNTYIKSFLVVLLIMISFNINAQTQKNASSEHSRTIDSLLFKFKSEKKDTSKVNICNSISQQFENFALEKAIIYAEQGMIIAEKIKFRKGLVASYNNLGNFNFKLGNFPKAIKFYQKALKICEELSFSTNAKEAGFGKTNMHKCFNNIGVVHHFLGNYLQAVEYYKKALTVFEETNDEKGISLCLNNIGMAYDDMGELEKSINCYEKSINISEKLSDEPGLSMCYNNIGLVYMKLNNYTKALDYYQKTLKIDRQLNDKEAEATVLGNIAELYCKLNDYNKSIEYSTQCLIVAKDVGSLFSEKQAYCFITEAYDSMHDYKKAYENHKLFKLINDSIYNEESSRQIKEMEAKYQNEKKQLEIEKLGKEKELQLSENRKQKIIILFVAGSLLLVIVFSAFLYRMFIQKKKANILLAQQKEEIVSQRDEIETQRDLVTQQKEHIEQIHEEQTDSIRYAERIQKAVLPGESNIMDKIQGDFFILFKPKDIVSGDFYFVEQRKNMLLIAVADCTGHGVPGAFMSMLGISFLNEIIAKDEVQSAGHVLDKLRQYVINSLQQKGSMGEQQDGMDISFIALNKETSTLEYAGANNPLYIIPAENNEISEIVADKMPIGIYGKMNPFKNNSIKVNKGDSLYLFSDGFLDQFGGENRKKFLGKRFKESLLQITHLPMREQKENLNNIFENWKGKTDQIDDVTVFGLKI